jgi:glycosyltransferase A (GT-A) superfamily protein (DUF2064 family)
VGEVQVNPTILQVLTQLLAENAVSPGNVKGRLAKPLGSKTMIRLQHELLVKRETKST